MFVHINALQRFNTLGYFNITGVQIIDSDRTIFLKILMIDDV